MLFFVWERLPFHNTIWHVFVLAATFVLYAAVLVELWGQRRLACADFRARGERFPPMCVIVSQPPRWAAGGFGTGAFINGTSARQ